MIVGGYDLHLYCRNNEFPIWWGNPENCPPQHHPYERDCAEFAAHNQRAAYSNARGAGWKFTDGDVLCPKCAKARP